MLQIFWAYKNVTPVRELAGENTGKIGGYVGKFVEEDKKNGMPVFSKGRVLQPST